MVDCSSKDLGIGGMDDTIDELAGSILTILNASHSPCSNVSSILVTGGVGSGKSFLVSRIISSMNIPSLFIKSASVIQANIGESEKYLHDVFSFADRNPKCVIAFDDIDIIVPAPASITSMFQVRLSTYLLQEIRRRNMLSKGTVFIGIVGENQLDKLNMELCCTGYMNRIVRIPRLDKRRRGQVIGQLLCSLSLDSSVRDWLCEQTASYSAADLNGFCSKVIEIASKEQEDKVTLDLLRQLLDSSAPSSARELHAIRPLNGGFGSLYGLTETIERIKETVLHPILHPEVYELYNLQPPSGAIFYGPSGTGKSAMIEAIATETKNQIQVIEISCVDILGKYLGDSEKKLREVFCLARQATPCILFLDNIESIAQIRGQDSTEGKTFDRLLSCLLTELDGLYSNRNQHVLVIGSTTNIHNLDSSVLRPGRLEEHVSFSIPLPAMRREMITAQLSSIPLEVESERECIIEWLCMRTSGKSAADIRGSIVKAVYIALKRDASCIRLSREILMESVNNKS